MAAPLSQSDKLWESPHIGGLSDREYEIDWHEGKIQCHCPASGSDLAGESLEFELGAVSSFEMVEELDCGQHVVDPRRSPPKHVEMRGPLASSVLC